ncbi:KilA-N domain-containing protein [Spartinivicinus ruber]|uniref:KilA-N domain-containing protein n=1 Tax=Spartinivicinus ruber TaxID=2683272 RepID=UPI0013D1113C|nr:KilA-N domain-containing protein [Spartinivicinus ruber]
MTTDTGKISTADIKLNPDMDEVGNLGMWSLLNSIKSHDKSSLEPEVWLDGPGGELIAASAEYLPLDYLIHYEDEELGGPELVRREYYVTPDIALSYAFWLSPELHESLFKWMKELFGSTTYTTHH